MGGFNPPYLVKLRCRKTLPGFIKTMTKFKPRTLRNPPKAKEKRKRRKRTGRVRFTRTQYLKLVEYFREHGEDSFAEAGRRAGCLPKTARRAMYEGWPSRVPPMLPIEEVLRGEAAAARAERAKVLREVAQRETAAQKDAHDDGVRTRVQEGLLVQASRTVAGKLLSQAVKLVSAVELMSDELAQQLVTEFVGETAFGEQKKSVAQKLQVLERIQAVAGKSTALAEAAMNLERKFMGEPEKVIAVHTMTADEAVEELLAGSRALARVVTDQAVALPLDLSSIEDPEAVLAAAGVPLTPETGGEKE